MRIRIRIQSDPYIIGSSGSGSLYYTVYGSGSSNLKTGHKLKNLEYFMNFFQICLKFFPSFSFLLKEFLLDPKKYKFNWNFFFFFLFKKIFLCQLKAWIRIRILKKGRIRIFNILIRNTGFFQSLYRWEKLFLGGVF